MSSPSGTSTIREILSRRTLPVFSAFFFWAFGTGGLWLVRPLFAYEIGGTFLAVAVVSAASALPRLVMGPVTGYLTDRFGRRPFVVLGAGLHIASLVGSFFVQDYWMYVGLEVVAGTGIAAYMTSANVLMADATRTGTRGRATAARQVSTRVGNLTGPIVGGLIATLFGLRAVFLFIAACKLAVILIAWLMIKETREPRAPKPAEATGRSRRISLPDLTMYRNRDFAALAVGTVALGLVIGGTGVFRTLFPPQAGEVAGLGEVAIGNLLTVASAFGLINSIPAGMALDKFGRKWPLVVGLLITAAGTYLMAITDSFSSALLAVIVFGLSEPLGQSAIQTYAMDQAPADRRGAFLGTWTLFTNMGQITGPLVIGTIADALGFQTAFTVVVVFLVAAAVFMGVIGRDSRAAATAREGASP